MTNNKSTYPQEWIAQDSIHMQSELAQQSAKLVTQNNILFISIDGTKYTCTELVHIVRSYYKARDTLLWIANCKPIIECGYPDILQRAKETLEEIEDDKRNDK